MQKSLAEILKNNPLAGSYLLAAAKMDDDYKKNLLPAELGDAAEDKQMLWQPCSSSARGLL